MSFVDTAGFVVRRPARTNESGAGREVVAQTNNVRLRIRSTGRVVVYAVSFEPDIGENTDPKIATALKKSVLDVNGEEVKARLDAKFVLNSGTNAWAFIEDGQPKSSVNLDLTSKGGEKYAVSFKLNKELCIDASTETFRPEQLLFFNIIVKENLRKLDMSMINRHCFDLNSVRNVGTFNVKIFTGYYVTVSQTEAGMALLVDLTHKTLQEMSAADLIRELQKKHNGPTEGFKGDVEGVIKGRVMMTTVSKDRKIAYRIDEIDWTQTVESKFSRRDGSEVSYKAYFKAAHNIELRETNMPMLISYRGKDKKKQCALPAELCKVCGLDDNLRSNSKFMMELANHTRLKPNVKIPKAMELIDKLIQARGNDMAAMGIECINTPIEVVGREVLEEKLRVFNEFDEAKKMVRGEKARGNDINRLRINFPHFMQKGIIGWGPDQGTNFKDWVIAYPERDEGAAENVKMTMKRLADQYRIRLNPPAMVPIRNPRGRDYAGNLRQFLSPDVMQNRKPSMIICLILGEAETYNELKKLLESQKNDLGIPSQMVQVKTLLNKGDQAMPKIFHQMVVKMGGQLWALNIPAKGKITMVVGIDVLRSGGKIYVAVTGSYNPEYVGYHHKVGCLDDIQQVGAFLSGAIKDLCIAFYNKIKKQPQRIIIYRDGVGESQKPSLRGEIEGCVEALEKLDKAWASSVGMAYIVVSKKVNQRFAIKITEQHLSRMADSSRGGRGGGRGGASAPPQVGQLTNPMPLTVFDNGIVDANKFDFFCVHQEVTAGTVTPTHYDVMNWTMKEDMTPTELADFTCQLSMLYQNWPGPIRVPAPVMYATKLCTRMATNLKENYSPKLCDRLFFL